MHQVNEMAVATGEKVFEVPYLSESNGVRLTQNFPATVAQAIQSTPPTRIIKSRDVDCIFLNGWDRWRDKDMTSFRWDGSRVRGLGCSVTGFLCC